MLTSGSCSSGKRLCSWLPPPHQAPPRSTQEGLELGARWVRPVEEGSPRIQGQWPGGAGVVSSGAPGPCAPGLGFLGETRVANMIVPEHFYRWGQ